MCIYTKLIVFDTVNIQACEAIIILEFKTSFYTRKSSRLSRECCRKGSRKIVRFEIKEGVLWDFVFWEEKIIGERGVKDTRNRVMPSWIDITGPAFLVGKQNLVYGEREGRGNWEEWMEEKLWLECILWEKNKWIK